jgi:hypothetical protein
MSSYFFFETMQEESRIREAEKMKEGILIQKMV